MTERPLPRLGLLLALLIALVGAALLVGAVRVPFDGALRGLFAGDLAAGDTGARLVREIRLPRVLLGALVGAALSLSGALLQAFFQNPMAGPYTVGVSAGGGLFAVATTVLGLSFRFGPLDTTALAAFAGGLLAVGLVYGIARKIHFARAEGLLLVGIAVGAVFSAVTSLLLVLSKDRAPTALFWMLGSFSNARWSSVALVGLVILISGVHSFIASRDLNLMLWGDEVAESLGSPVRRIQIWVLLHSSLLAAAAVASCGVIGFVGLMVPHIARGFLRTSDHRLVLPGSALIGAMLVLLADGAARVAFAPLELPVGAITSMLGAPFLVYLVARRERRVRG